MTNTRSSNLPVAERQAAIETRTAPFVNPRLYAKTRQDANVAIRHISSDAIVARTIHTREMLDTWQWQTLASDTRPLYCRKTGAVLGAIDPAAIAAAALVGNLPDDSLYFDRFTHPAWLVLRDDTLERLQLVMPVEFCVYSIAYLFYNDTLSPAGRHAIHSAICQHDLAAIVELAETLRRIAAVLGKHCHDTLSFSHDRWTRTASLNAAIVRDVELAAANRVLDTMPTRRLTNVTTRDDIIRTAMSHDSVAFHTHCDITRAHNANVHAALSNIPTPQERCNIQFSNLPALITELRNFMAEIVKEIFNARHRKDAARRGRKTITLSDIMSTRMTLGNDSFARDSRSRQYDNRLLAELADHFSNDDDWTVSFHDRDDPLSPIDAPEPIAIDLNADEPSDDALRAMASSHDDGFHTAGGARTIDDARAVNVMLKAQKLDILLSAAREAHRTAAAKPVNPNANLSQPHAVTGFIKL